MSLDPTFPDVVPSIKCGASAEPILFFLPNLLGDHILQEGDRTNREASRRLYESVKRRHRFEIENSTDQKKKVPGPQVTVLTSDVDAFANELLDAMDDAIMRGDIFQHVKITDRRSDLGETFRSLRKTYKDKGVAQKQLKALLGCNEVEKIFGLATALCDRFAHLLATSIAEKIAIAMGFFDYAALYSSALTTANRRSLRSIQWAQPDPHAKLCS